MIGQGINDFYNVHDAVPDADGLIEAVLIPLIDLVIFPNMVTPLLIRREQDIAAIRGRPDAPGNGDRCDAARS